MWCINYNNKVVTGGEPRKHNVGRTSYLSILHENACSAQQTMQESLSTERHALGRGMGEKFMNKSSP